MFDWNSELLLALLGVVLSLIFAYLPGVKEWFETLDSRWKPLVNLGALLLVTAGRLVWLCKADLACMQINLPAALMAFLTALVSNQMTFTFLVKQFKKFARSRK